MTFVRIAEEFIECTFYLKIRVNLLWIIKRKSCLYCCHFLYTDLLLEEIYSVIVFLKMSCSKPSVHSCPRWMWLVHILELQSVRNKVHSEFCIYLMASGCVHYMCFTLNTYGALHFIKWNHKPVGDQNEYWKGRIRKIRVRILLAWWFQISKSHKNFKYFRNIAQT